MARSPLAILLTAVLVLHTAMTGLAFCSGGGCCHAPPADAAAPCDGDHGHSVIVPAEPDHDDCGCRDLEVDEPTLVPGKRDELGAARGPTWLALATAPALEVVAVAFPSPPSRAGPPGDAAMDGRLAVVRAVRLRL